MAQGGAAHRGGAAIQEQSSAGGRNIRNASYHSNIWHCTACTGKLRHMAVVVLGVGLTETGLQ